MYEMHLNSFNDDSLIDLKIENNYLKYENNNLKKENNDLKKSNTIKLFYYAILAKNIYIGIIYKYYFKYKK